MDQNLEPGAVLRATLTGGKNLIFRIPPLPGEAVHVLHELLEKTDGLTIVLCPDRRSAGRLHDIISPLETQCHEVTGLARTARLLDSGTVRVIVALPSDALALVRMSSLDPAGIGSIVVCWPELMPEELTQGLDLFLADSGKTRKALIAGTPQAPGDLEKRFFWRAGEQSALGTPNDVVTDRPRYVLAGHSTSETIRRILDTMNPESTVIWTAEPGRAPAWTFPCDAAVRSAHDTEFDPVDLVIATELPRPSVIAELSRLSKRMVLLVDAFQLPYLSSIAPSARPLRLPSEADVYRDELTALRRRVRKRVSEGDYRHYFGVIEPLLDEFDPATLAAAVLELAVGSGQAEPEPEGTWARVHVNAGKIDDFRTSDLVGALINSAGVQKQDIGRVEMRDRFSLIDVRPAALDTAIEGLTGLNLKGRSLRAKQDRH